MSEAEASAPVAAAPKKVSKASAKPRAKPAHPKISDMVDSAIKHLKERGGSSLQAIKKYLAVNYKVDAEKLSPFIKKYLKSAVGAGKLVQTKGKGASGSFKLASKEKAEKAEKKKQQKKKKAASKPSGSSSPAKKASAGTAKKAKAAGGVKKATTAKKSTAAAAGEKVKSAPAKKPAAKKPKSPSKAKTATKAPAAKKPKTPKPKKAAAKPKAAKKAPAKKK